MAEEDDRSRLWSWGLTLVLLGLIIVGLSVVIDATAKALQEDPNRRLADVLAGQSFIWGVATDLGKSVGLALLAMGAFNVILDFPSWTKYFRRQLQEVVASDSYLSTFDIPRLRRLILAAAKSAFQDERLDREGGFLRYFVNHLFVRLAEPYRENVQVDLYVTEIDQARLRVVDHVTYTCREARGSVQPSVPWFNDDDLVMEALVLVLRLPVEASNANSATFRYEVPAEDLQKSPILNHPLVEPYNVDGVRVELTATYTVAAAGVHVWRMPTSTRNFNLTIRYPGKFKVQFETFVPDTHLVEVRRPAPDTLTCACNAWMLAETGVAWGFIGPTSPTR